jgi:hypothetical protein
LNFPDYLKTRSRKNQAALSASKRHLAHQNLQTLYPSGNAANIDVKSPVVAPA